MGRSKSKTNTSEIISEEVVVTPIEEEKKTEPVVEEKREFSNEQLLTLVESLAKEVAQLKSGQKSTSNDTNDQIAELLKVMASKKSDKEVAIVHNCELLNGLTTHITLSNLTIDFTKIGEQRLLSWQQFEECASNYRSFFDRGIILVASEYADDAEKYNLPCEKPKSHRVTHKDIAMLPSMTATELESFINNLDSDDKDMIISYWLGKCYTREPGFYDRYKMDTLNRISNGEFTNILLVMNGEDTQVNN